MLSFIRLLFAHHHRFIPTVPIMSSSSHIPNNPAEKLSPLNVKHNTDIVSFSRTFIAIFSGCGAGILGLTNLSGFLFYAIVNAVCGIFLLMKAGGFANNNVKQYFQHWSSIVFDGFVGGCLSFVLFWT